MKLIDFGMCTVNRTGKRPWYLGSKGEELGQSGGNEISKEAKEVTF